MYKIGLSDDTRVLLIGNSPLIRLGSFFSLVGVGWGRVSDFTQDSVEYFLGRRSKSIFLTFFFS